MRQRILDVAEKLFAWQGYAATPLREIAESADVNPAMVHYYFGSKHDLLRQVLERIFEPLATAIAGMKQAQRAPALELSRLITATVREHPNLPILMVREVLLPGGTMQEAFLDDMAPRLGGAFPGLLAGEQRQGRLAHDLDPGITALLLLALSIFPYIVRNVAERRLDVSYDEAGLDALERHIGRILERGIAK